MANLGPQKINLSYDGLLQVPGGLTASLQNVTDGNGNNSGLQLSTNGIGGPIVSDNVVITGGTINGTTIGATSAAAGHFTNLSVSGTTTLGSPLSGILKGSAGIIGVATAGADYVSPSVLGAANGVATLGADSKLTASQLPAIAVTEYLGAVASQAEMLALTGQAGDWCTRTDLGTNWVITGSNPSVLADWTQLSYPTAPVTSVNGLTGAVSLSYTNVGAAPATTGSSILYANGSGGFANVTVGSGLSFAGGNLTATGSGLVSSLSVASSNGFAGTSSGGSTPVITLSTTVSGLLKGNGTAISAATAGTDYQSAITATGILKGAGAGAVSAAVSGTDYAPGTSALNTGILKSTTGTGALSIAVVGTDYAPATTGTAILKGNGSGGFSNATSGTDYAPATSGTSILKGNGSGGFSNATSGTDYAPATSGTSILYGNGSGGFSNVTVGSGLTFVGGTLASVAGGGGTVTDMSVVTANGFAGTVATSTTTPAVTLTTTVTGILKGNGTAISAATAGSDYPGLASNNTYTGNQIISVNSSSDALRITQTGAGNALVVEDSANPDATPFVIDANGTVFAGANGFVSGFYTSESINASTSNAAGGQFNARKAITGTQGASINLLKSRGSIASQSVVLDGDTTGKIETYGYDGANYIIASRIESQVDGTPGTNDMPGRLVFSTTADGASSPTERMRIDSRGNVGIGSIAAAFARLQVAGTLPSSSAFSYGISSAGTVPSTSTSGYVGFDSAPTTQASAFTLSALTHFQAYQSALGAGSTVTTQYGFHANSTLTGATNNYGFYSGIASGTGRYNFYAAGTAQNYFAGNVGIGTTNPIVALHLAGTGGARQRFQNLGVRQWSIGNDASDFTIYDESAPAERLRIDSSGNLGLGVTPSGWSGGYKVFQSGYGALWSAANSLIHISGNTYFDGTSYRYIGTDYAQDYYQYQGAHVWRTAPSGTAGNTISFTQAMTLDASGNLLVGTTDTGEASGLGVKIRPTGTNTNVAIVGSTSTSATNGITIYSTGAANYRFYVDYAGVIHATSTSITAISDISLKENIRPLETGLTEVLALQPRRFDWRNGDGTDVAGFIAQEVESVLPDLVSDYKYNEEGTKLGLKMGDMIPTLVKAIQELSAQVSDLKAELNELKQKVNA